MQSQHQTEKVKIISLFDEKNQKEEKYMLSLHVVGEGKYGKVYKAVHVDKPDIVFAVKVIHLTSEKVRQQCIKELEIIKRLPKCLNLVKIHPQHLESQHNFYIFEEFCDGGTLYDEKKARMLNPFSQDQVFNIFFQVVSGFIQLRKAGIFHEDIKPQNILKKNNLYKITDFGISQLADKEEVSVIRKGTLIYMPPQKLSSAQYVPTSKSEIFSLGITLYEVFFGHPPFLSKKPLDYKNYLKMLKSAKLKSVEELKGYFKNVSLRFDKLIRIILRMIQLNQTKRLSLEQLTEYITKSEPFMSMKITEVNTNSKAVKFSDKKKYEAIAYSKIYVQKTGQSISTALKPTESDDIEASLEVLKLYLQYFRNASSYLQQGLIYAKQAKIFELQKSFKYQDFHFASQVTYLEFVIAYYNDFGLGQVSKKFNQLIMHSNLDEQQIVKIDEQISGDMDFTKNQFLKIFTSLQLNNKKILLALLKDNQIKTGEQLVQMIQSIFEQINCVRINFKEDLLALVFLKNAGKILTFINDSLKLLQKDDQKGLANNIGSDRYDNMKKIMVNFSSFEALHRSKLENLILDEMKGAQEILYDIQSNSDQFQILEFEDVE